MKKLMLASALLVGTFSVFAETTNTKEENVKTVEQQEIKAETQKESKVAKPFIPVHTSCGETAYVYYNSNSTLLDVLIDAWELDGLVCGE